MARTAFALVMLGIAGGVALLLGTIGIYGVVSYAVSQCTREIGAGVGLLAAVGLTRLMASLLYGVNPIDLPTFGWVALALTAAGAPCCHGRPGPDVARGVR